MIFEQTSIVLKDGKKIVVKKFSDISSIKWFISIPFRPFYPFALSAVERMRREISFFKYRHNFISTPTIYNVDWNDKIIEREYVEGEPLSECDLLESSKMLAKVLATLHSEGWCLGDTKLSNIIMSRDTIYVIDGEQAIKSSNEVYVMWDIASSLILLGVYNPREAVIESTEVLYHFYKEYSLNGGNVSMIDRSIRFLRKFIGAESK